MSPRRTISMMSKLLAIGSLAALLVGLLIFEHVQAQASPGFDMAYVYQGDIYLANVAYGQVVGGYALTGDGSNNDPAWSPDGRYLMYTHYDWSTPNLRILDALTGQTTLNLAGACCGAWHPISGDIAYYDVDTGTLITAAPDNSNPVAIWQNTYGSLEAWGRMAWAPDGTIYMGVALGDAAFQVRAIHGMGQDELIVGPDLGGFGAASNAISSPAVSPVGDLSVTIHTEMLAVAPGGPHTYLGYGGTNTGGIGIWQADLGFGDHASWSPDGQWIVWEQWVSCQDLGLDMPGYCKGGIGLRDVFGGSQTLLLQGEEYNRPAWRPAIPSLPDPPTDTPTPTVTDWPTYTPTPTPAPMVTPSPASSSVLCGKVETIYIYSGMTAYPRAVIVPCGETQPIELGGLGQFGDDGVYRFTDPVFQPVPEYDTELGLINTKLESWAQSEVIDSCQVCNLADASPQWRNSLYLGLVSVEPAQPVALEPVTLVLSMQAEGSTLADAPYLVDVTFGEDFPYDYIHYTFDSEDPVSAAHLDPLVPPAGNYELRITGLRFPHTYSGSVVVSVRLKDSDMPSSLGTHISVSEPASLVAACSGAFLKGLNLLAEVPLPLRVQVAATNQYLEYQDRLVYCGDDSTCQAEALVAFHEATVDTAIGLSSEFADFIGLLNQVPGLRVVSMAKRVVDMGLDPVKCGQSIVTFIQRGLHDANMQMEGQEVDGFMTASPVYPLITDRGGQQTGFLPDGSLVEEIPGAYAVEIGEKRVVLAPADIQGTLEISGYASGTMNLYLMLDQAGGQSLDITYADVPVQSGIYMQLDPSGDQMPLLITVNGQTERRLPDLMEIVLPSGGIVAASQAPLATPTNIPSILAGAQGVKVVVVLAAIILVGVGLLFAVAVGILIGRGFRRKS